MSCVRRLVVALVAAVLAAASVQAAGPASTRVVDLGDGVTMEFVLIAPGRFQMGSVPDVGDGDEKPQHAVTITAPYYLGRFEVTQRQWQRVMGGNPSQFRGPNLPVDSVSWDDCQQFVERLSKRSGLRIALPTEAQWEYACRAGTTTLWPAGDDEAAVREFAWIEANSGGATHPVGLKKPNRWGLYDMSGNVAEWCVDWYANPYPAGDALDPRGPATGEARVLRGGNASDAPYAVRSAARNCMGPKLATPGTGLRCVIVINP